MLLPCTDEAGFPQDGVWQLHNFRAAKLSLRFIIGRAVGELFAVDMYALMGELESV